MVSFYNTNNQHKDLRPTRIERDEKILFFTDELASISTGAIPLADINEDLLAAHQKKKAAYIQHIEERLSQNKPKSFFAPIRRMSLKTILPITKKIIRIDNKVITFKIDPDWLGKRAL